MKQRNRLSVMASNSLLSWLDFWGELFLYLPVSMEWENDTWFNRVLLNKFLYFIQAIYYLIMSTCGCSYVQFLFHNMAYFMFLQVLHSSINCPLFIDGILQQGITLFTFPGTSFRCLSCIFFYCAFDRVNNATFTVTSHVPFENDNEFFSGLDIEFHWNILLTFSFFVWYALPPS